jgi:peptidoglycan hydrolase-like protein with peptidoglycan-binding domain
MTKQEVTNLQYALNLYPSSLAKLKVDGVLGSKTLARIKEFQKKNGLAQTGVPQSAMLAKLGLNIPGLSLAAMGGATQPQAGLFGRVATTGAQTKLPGSNSSGGDVAGVPSGSTFAYHAKIGLFVNASSASDAMAEVRSQLESAGWKSIKVTSGGLFSTDLFVSGKTGGDYADDNAVRTYLDSVASAQGFSVEAASSTISIKKKSADGGNDDDGGFDLEEIFRQFTDFISSPSVLLVVGLLIFSRSRR